MALRMKTLLEAKRALGREPYETLRFWSPPRWESSGLASRAEIRSQEQAIASVIRSR